MRSPKLHYLWVILLMFALRPSATAQDIHFSQFYAVAPNLNPALTGMINEHYRAAAIYRNQWRSINKLDGADLAGENSVSESFVTYAAAFDARLFPEVFKRDIVGVGGVLFYDKAGAGGLGTLNIMGSAAFHKQIGEGHFIGAGLQAGFVQKSLNTQNLVFASQFDPNQQQFNRNIPINENFNGNTGYFDMQLGLNWQSTFAEKYGVYSGFALHHITQPTESFMNQQNSLKMRITGHGGARIQLNDNMFLSPNYILMFQGGASEINTGMSFEYHFNDEPNNMVMGVGGWYRFGDAAIISASMEIRKIRLGVAYDFTVSDLRPAANGNGGFELALTYRGFFESGESSIVVPCPRM